MTINLIDITSYDHQPHRRKFVWRSASSMEIRMTITSSSRSKTISTSIPWTKVTISIYRYIVTCDIWHVGTYHADASLYLHLWISIYRSLSITDQSQSKVHLYGMGIIDSANRLSRCLSRVLDLPLSLANSRSRALSRSIYHSHHLALSLALDLSIKLAATSGPPDILLPCSQHG